MSIRNTFYEHAKSIVLLPMMAIVVIPLVIIIWVPQWNLSYLIGSSSELLFGIGILLFLLSIAFFISTLVLFIRISQGTLAPWSPSKRLVIRSYYRHSRNPMILGVLSILLSISLVFDSVALLGWCGLFLIGNHFYLILVEERDLADRFGEEYLEYRQNVPRWWPRRKGWRPEEDK